MSIIPDKLLIKVQHDFKTLDKDGNNVLNVKKDGISTENGANYFIDLNQDIDIETFYQYNADKYGEDLTDAFEAKREEVRRAYAELKTKEKPSLEPEYRIDPSDKTSVDNFYRNPKDGMIYNFKGTDIKYENGQYSCPGTDYEPAKNIYGMTFQIIQDIRSKFYDEYNSKFDKAETEKKGEVVDNYVKGLLNFDGRFNFDYLAANYNTGTKLSKTVTIGTENNKNRVLINFTLGEKEVILDDYKFYPVN